MADSQHTPKEAIQESTELIEWAKKQARKKRKTADNLTGMYPRSPLERDAKMLDAIAARLEADRYRFDLLRRWMTENKDDKYTGHWWLAELDRVISIPDPEAHL